MHTELDRDTETAGVEGGYQAEQDTELKVRGQTTEDLTLVWLCPFLLSSLNNSFLMHITAF